MPCVGLTTCREMRRADRTSETRIRPGARQIEQPHRPPDSLALMSQSDLSTSNQQMVGLDQIAQAMTTINKAASENLGTTQLVEQSGEQFNSVANKLGQIVATYRLES